jgi:hypothetical protein
VLNPFNQDHQVRAHCTAEAQSPRRRRGEEEFRFNLCSDLAFLFPAANYRLIFIQNGWSEYAAEQTPYTRPRRETN